MKALLAAPLSSGRFLLARRRLFERFGRFRRLDGHSRVVLALLAMGAVWALSFACFFETPPWDNVEELFWARSFELGYYKHPPLPSWIMGLLVRIVGAHAWVTYGAGVACGIAALYLVWRWSAELVAPRRAVLALALGSLVTYHVQSATIYNHNTVQLFPIAGYWWMLWRVLRDPPSHSSRPSRPSRRADWLWLGVFAALAFLTKYSAVVQFAVGLGFIVRQGSWKRPDVRAGLGIAAGVALAIVSPHLVWVMANPDLSIAYALHSVHSKGDAVAAFNHQGFFHVLRLQLLRLSPMLLFVLWAWSTRTRQASMTSVRSVSSMSSLSLRSTDDANDANAFDRRFLAWAAFGPALLVLGAALVLRMDLVPSWLTTFFLPAGLWAVHRIAGLDAEHWPRRRWHGVLAVVACVHVVAALGQGWVEGVLWQSLGRTTRTNLPARQIAVALDDVWRQHAGPLPFELLAGDTWFAGAVARKMRPGMELLVDGDERFSPWLPAGMLAKTGAMVVILDTPDFRSEAFMLETRMAQAACRGSLWLPWGNAAVEKGIQLRWGILMPVGVKVQGCA